jgi:hypothetical protein
MNLASLLPLKLVPITLDFEIDRVVLKDCFCWNLNGNDKY